MGNVKKRVSNVFLIPAVEGISRKLALRRETCINAELHRGDTRVVIPGHTYMGVVNKTKNIIGYGSVSTNTLFMRKPITLGLPTSSQMTGRQRFSEAMAWAAAAQKDLSAISNNQQKFIAAKNDFTKTISGVSAYGYQGMRGWMAGVAYATLANGGTLSQDHELPAFDA